MRCAIVDEYDGPAHGDGARLVPHSDLGVPNRSFPATERFRVEPTPGHRLGLTVVAIYEWNGLDVPVDAV